LKICAAALNTASRLSLRDLRLSSALAHGDATFLSLTAGSLLIPVHAEAMQHPATA